MIPLATDVVTFEDSLFNGGLLNEEFWSDWWYNASKAVCGELKSKDFIGIAKAHPFYDPKIYGPNGEIFMTPDLSKITIPQWISMPTGHPRAPSRTRQQRGLYPFCFQGQEVGHR